MFKMKNLQDFFKARIFWKGALDIESRIIPMFTHFAGDQVGCLNLFQPDIEPCFTSYHPPISS